jgi:23S rRNA pseudouridine2457 synthase
MVTRAGRTTAANAKDDELSSISLPKVYFVQVEGMPEPAELQALAQRVDLRDFVTRPVSACVIAAPAGLWPRDPPVHVRKSVPTLVETGAGGRTQPAGTPHDRCGRPVDVATGSLVDRPWHLEGLAPGAWRRAQVEMPPIAKRHR